MPTQSAEDRFERLTDRAENFSAQDKFEETARAGFELIRTPLQEEMERLQGSQVAAGRLNTGFGVQDQARLQRDVFQNFNTQLQSRALDTVGFDLQGLGLAGDFASGTLNRQLLKELEDRKKKGGLLSGLGGLAGFLISGGNPAGAMVGAGVGQGVGEFFG